MAADPRWDQLTLSAKAAWRWAWATATTRTGAAEPSGVQVDAVDLLAGLALAHPRDNPVSQLFEHFRIPPGAVLTDDGMRRYDPAALLAAYRHLPDAELPPLDKQAEHVLQHACTAMPPSSDGLVTLSMLFAALLEDTNSASRALRAELSRRCVDAEPLLRSCREHLDTRRSYAEYLREHHPYRPPELHLPPYTPDEPRARQLSAQPDTEPHDLIDIGAEVDAFAYLIASTTLTPPLAIGLFGDWGSGKSYFLRSVQHRIDQLVRSEVDQSSFHRDIVQVEFNAWQYVEGNLWASLLEHLFRNLRKAGEQDTDDLLEVRRSEYLSQIAACTAAHRRADAEREKLAEQQQHAQQLVQHKQQERDRQLANLEEARQRNPFLGWRPSSELSGTLDVIGQRTGLGTLSTQVNELQHTLASTGEALRRAGPVLGALRTGGWRYTVALLVVIGLGPLASFVLSQLDISAVSTVLGSVSAVLAGITAYAARGSTLLADLLGTISRAQAELNAELDAQREQLNQEVRDAERTLADTQRELATAVQAEQQLAASVAELEAELVRITPSRVLAEFLGDRVASDDYRRHLGVPALVRQDLERLSRLVQQRHHAARAGQCHEADSAKGIDEQHAIDRVVLYIDDLDRCPTHLVIKVLEAVHLLLSFPLFVVVVAVDARWLESSLREHYAQLRGEAATSADTPVPADYLEKIFQVPFWVRPLGADTRRQMVRGLLMPALAGPEVVAETGGDSPAAGIELAEADLPEFTRLVESFTATNQADPPWHEVATLTVTGPELCLVEDVSSLIRATPRAVKRFVNVYLLVKSIGRNRGWSLPSQGQVAVLLAIATGLPELADELLPNLTTAEPVTPVTLKTALPATAAGAAAEAQLDRLKGWLNDHPACGDLPLDGMGRWIELILRFRFDRVPVADVAHPG